MQYRKYNFHIAKRCHLDKINQQIADYSKQYATPKYLAFIKMMLEAGWMVKIYIAGPSKYVFVVKHDEIYKIRFSNHKPICQREITNDCDFYVGISHLQSSKMEDVAAKIIGKNAKIKIPC